MPNESVITFGYGPFQYPGNRVSLGNYPGDKMIGEPDRVSITHHGATIMLDAEALGSLHDVINRYYRRHPRKATNDPE